MYTVGLDTHWVESVLPFLLGMQLKEQKIQLTLEGTCSGNLYVGPTFISKDDY